MNALLKPLLATLTLAAIAYGSHAQTQSTAIPCSSTDAAVTCGEEPQPQWMGVDAAGAGAVQRSAAEAAPVVREAKRTPPVKRTSAKQPSPPAIASPGSATPSKREADAGSVTEPNTVALILAALGVIGLISRRRFGA
jgi:hypothetical protein